jgi:hypothetical protein
MRFHPAPDPQRIGLAGFTSKQAAWIGGGMTWIRVGAMALLLALQLIDTAFAATFVPFKIRYEATFEPPKVVSLQPYVVSVVDQISGDGTHLGQFTGSYPHFANFTDLTFRGTAVLTADNGDLLSIELGGTGAPTGPTTFAVNFQGVIAGGTGRFAGATGSVSGPGVVDLSALKVNAVLEGLISK